MDRIGRIKEIVNNEYHIKTIPSEKCADCNVCQAERDIWLDTEYYDKNFKEGEFIKLKYDRKFSYLIFLIYISPVFLLIIGAYIANLLFTNQLYVIFTSIGFMGAGISIIRRIDYKFKKKFIPELERYEPDDKEVI